MYGNAGKILRVNLTKSKVNVETLKEGFVREYIGGNGFATKILCDELSPETPPLSPGNKIVFAVGPLSGTRIPMCSRYVVVAKSPLTNIWGEGDAGGFWGTELKWAGFDAIVVEGSSEKPVYLWISNGKAEICDAKDLWGMDSYETEKALRNELGSKVKVACIGQAGENLVKIASIMNDGGRTAAHSGLGAVMGSKKLKAIATKGDIDVEVFNEEEVKELTKQMLKELLAHPLIQYLSRWGVAGDSLESNLLRQNLPLKNWSQVNWSLESAQLMGSRRMEEKFSVTRKACYGCPIGCAKIVKVESGPFAMQEQGRGPEYETLAALGSLCLNDDIDAVCKANDLCNRYGLDTIATGTLIAFIMECLEKEILSKQDIGTTLEWGNGEAVVELVRMIGTRKGIGNTLAEGVSTAAVTIGRGASEFAMHVKGSPIPMHDPRIDPVRALNYATVSVGANHGKLVPGKNESDDLTPSQIALRTVSQQTWSEVVDCLVMCRFAFFFGGVVLSREFYVPKLLSAVTGQPFTEQKLFELGNRLFDMKQFFNTKQGVGREHDRLPTRFTKIPRVLGEEKYNVDLTPSLAEYYKIRRWSEQGVPSSQGKN
ncbi:MAG TPA: aldehyde ferredoxin oxidoreductase family protein [Candidatus Bathyarchaeia archaeon]|nr:aldehyde ferredoxin oxidoreductase family protein [Candidatus Bathyarchaeia archaeon]